MVSGYLFLKYFSCLKSIYSEKIYLFRTGNPNTRHSDEGEAPKNTMRVRRRRKRGLDDIKVHNLMQGIGLNSSYLPEGFNISSLSNMSLVNDSDVTEEDHIPYLAAVVYGQTEIILADLKHFQEYNIEVSNFY